MIYAPWYAYVLWLSIALIYAEIGARYAVFLPWSSKQNTSKIQIAFGLACSPLVMGIIWCCVMYLLPGYSNYQLIAFTFISILLFTLSLKNHSTGIIALFNTTTSEKLNLKRNAFEMILWVILGVLLLMLWGFAIHIPLFQNDPLEYMSAARVLYGDASLSHYPVLDSTTNPYGFYGPWTHPPLYTAWIVLSFILQHNPNMPGVARLITPWCLTLSTLLIYFAGAIHGRRAGLISAILFLSTPLLYLGADSSCIDALPVLGATLLIVAMIYFDIESTNYGYFIGLILGISLWTHSQAIIFIPMVFGCLGLQWGLNNFKKYIATLFKIVIVTLFISGYPYLCNYLKMGAIASDNPPVFMLKTLEWSSYFSIERGISTWSAKIQYGLFKGWFAFEAYSLIFWFALISYIFIKLNHKATATIFIASRWFFMYWLAILGLLVIHNDTLIKNERYWLIVCPAVALIAGFGFHLVLNTLRNKYSNIIKVLLVIYCIGLSVLFYSYRVVFGETKLQDNAAWTIIHQDLAHEHEGKVLTLKPADFYYSNRKIVSYLDPLMIDFYQLKNIDAAVVFLKKNGINYIYFPDYYLPPINHSLLQSILADANLAELIQDKQGYQLYKLKTPHQFNKTEYLNLLSPNNQWQQTEALVVGGRKAIGQLTSNKNTINPVKSVWLENSHLLFQRDRVVTLTSEKIDVPEYQSLGIKGNFYGEGEIKITLMQFNALGDCIPIFKGHKGCQRTIVDLALSSAHSESFARQFLPLPKAKYMQLTISLQGYGVMHADSLNLFSYLGA